MTPAGTVRTFSANHLSTSNREYLLRDHGVALGPDLVVTLPEGELVIHCDYLFGRLEGCLDVVVAERQLEYKPQVIGIEHAYLPVPLSELAAADGHPDPLRLVADLLATHGAPALAVLEAVGDGKTAMPLAQLAGLGAALGQP